MVSKAERKLIKKNIPGAQDTTVGRGGEREREVASRVTFYLYIVISIVQTI